MPPVSDPAASGNLRLILRSPSLLTREVLAGVLTAIQAIALAVSSPLLGKLVDKFGQRQVKSEAKRS